MVIHVKRWLSDVSVSKVASSDDKKGNDVGEKLARSTDDVNNKMEIIDKLDKENKELRNQITMVSKYVLAFSHFSSWPQKSY